MLTAYKRSEGAHIELASKLEDGEWIRLETPTPEEISSVSSAFSLDESLILDALDPYEAPRFEVEDKVPYIFLRYPYSDNPPGTAPLLIIVAKNTILTVSKGTPSFLERFSTGEIDFSTEHRTKLLILFMAEMTTRYTSAMTAIQRAVNRRKQSVSDMEEADILELLNHESAVNIFLDALIPQANALTKLESGRTLSINEEDQDLIDDVILSTSQLIELGRSLLKSMENTRKAYTAISTQRLNQIIRRLTILTVLITIPNAITGFYGMNVALPGAESSGAAFVIFASIVFIVTSAALLLIWRRWL